jgi:precorrin-6B methylase 2
MAPFVAAHDFSRYGVVADLGGAGGGLLAAILIANPRARGILVDRKEAVANAASRLKTFGVADRCEVQAGDLLETIPSGADAFILKCVLHGYDDEKARRILKNCCRSMSSEDRLLVIEVVLPTTVGRADPAVEKMLMGDINMLAVTGGRERSEADWSALLKSAGYELCRIVTVSGQTASIIECVPRE